MNRRESLKSLVIGTVGGGLGLNVACRTDATDAPPAEIAAEAEAFYGRTPAEARRDDRLQADTFFRPHELVTLTAVANVILPPGPEGGIEEAEVPAFIEFMAKDRPAMQGPLRAGLAYLDREAKRLYGKTFVELGEGEYRPILDEIAFYDAAVPEAERPREVNFFSLLRNLVVTGYFTSAVGVADLGYQGNVPNIWDGVPADVLAEHDVDLDPEWAAKCIDQERRGEIAEWDEAGNLLT